MKIREYRDGFGYRVKINKDDAEKVMSIEKWEVSNFDDFVSIFNAIFHIHESEIEAERDNSNPCFDHQWGISFHETEIVRDRMQRLPGAFQNWLIKLYEQWELELQRKRNFNEKVEHLQMIINS